LLICLGSCYTERQSVTHLNARGKVLRSFKSLPEREALLARW
jgi:hypothetical protein